MEKVYRIHLKTNCENRLELINYCLNRKENCLAIGWSGTHDSHSCSDYDSFYEATRKNFKRTNPALNVFKNAEEGDLFWTRDTNGFYWICRTIGKAKPHYNKSLDIGAILPVEVYKVGLEVPGEIKASFNRSRGGTTQQFHGQAMIEYSKYIFNKISGKNIYKVEKISGSISNNLPDFDLEELIVSYIQLKENYYVLSNSIANKSTTIKIECEFITRDLNHFKKAVVQVKGKKANPIDALDYLEYLNNGYTVYLYAPTILNLEKVKGCVEITEQKILQFYEEYKNILPQSITKWENLFE